jgi:hypothetical protein
MPKREPKQESTECTTRRQRIQKSAIIIHAEQRSSSLTPSPLMF